MDLWVSSRACICARIDAFSSGAVVRSSLFLSTDLWLLIQEFSNQSQEALVLDSFTQDVDHDRMVDVVEEALYVSFNEPFASCKAILNHTQCGMTASIRSKAVRSVRKTALVYGFQQHAYNLLYQLVVDGRNAQWTQLPVLFRDVRPSRRLRLIRFVFQGLNEPVYAFHAHCVDGFSVCACGHISLIGVHVLIRLKEKFPVKQIAVQSVVGIVGLR